MRSEGASRGNRVIQDSDDDMSDDSLDLPSLIPKAAPPLPPLAFTTSTSAIATIRTAKKAKIAVSKKSALPSFDALLEEEKQYRVAKKTEESMHREMQDDMRPLSQEPSPGSKKFMYSSHHDSTKDIRRNIVQRTMGNEDVDTVRRVERAMEKVGAAASACAFYFFDPENIPKSHPGKPFPSSAPDAWKKLLADEQIRSQNLSSGLPERVARKGGIPGDVFTWMVRQMICDPAPVSRDRYQTVLLANPSDLLLFLDPQTIDGLFSLLGSSCDLQNDSDPLEPVVEVQNAYANRSWLIEISLLKFLSSAAQHLSPPSLVKLGKAVVRMFADEALMSQPIVREACQSILLKIANHCPKLVWEVPFCSELLASCFSIFKDAYLQHQVMSKIPIANLPHIIDLRRRLAATFLFDGATFANEFSLLTLSDLSHRLSGKDMKITRETDYERFLDRVRIWEVALQGVIPSPSQTVLEFDQEVDGLVEKIKFLQASVKGGDAANVIRIQAREYLMELAKRMPFTVRTTPPKRKDHYDAAIENEQRQREKTKMQSAFMDKFLAAGGSTSVTASACAITNGTCPKSLDLTSSLSNLSSLADLSDSG